MASQSYGKEKIVEIVEFLSQYEYELVYYQFVNVSTDLYQIQFFGLHKEDRENLEIAIDLRFC